MSLPPNFNTTHTYINEQFQRWRNIATRLRRILRLNDIYAIPSTGPIADAVAMLLTAAQRGDTPGTVEAMKLFESLYYKPRPPQAKGETDEPNHGT